MTDRPTCAALVPNSRGSDEPDIGRLATFIARHRGLLVLTGAGCSTSSGIPDYRDPTGEWKHPRPVLYPDFVRDPAVRRRYWARSITGWRRIADARPNDAHRALAGLERRGFVTHLVTQNVDGLHQQAGSNRVTDLHGRLDGVRCLHCSQRYSRADFQTRLETHNPDWADEGQMAPDGDMELGAADYASFVVPDCKRCGGILKPDVVFFGEAIPRQRAETALGRMASAAAVLVVGSSLAVFSGFRFARGAADRGIPLAAVNRGWTRADELLDIKIDGDCTDILPAVVDQLTRS